MTLIPKDIRDLNSEEALTLQVHHIMGQLIDCLKSVEPAPGNDDAVYLDFWNDMEMGEVLKRAEAWIDDNPKPLIIEPFPVYDEEPQSYSPDIYSDDGEALASAGFGTDEDYGGGDERL